MNLNEVLLAAYGKSISECSNAEIYAALLKETDAMASQKCHASGKKKLYYISAEFLIGKLLSNNLINLGIYEDVKAQLVWSVIISLGLAVIWPLIQSGINAFGIWIANSSDTSPVLAPFIYGTLERLLLPFGLHHMLTIPMNYTSFGGTYEILTGVSAGSEVFGQDPLWLAWVTDLINLKDGDMAG